VTLKRLTVTKVHWTRYHLLCPESQRLGAKWIDGHCLSVCLSLCRERRAYKAQKWQKRSPWHGEWWPHL